MNMYNICYLQWLGGCHWSVQWANGKSAAGSRDPNWKKGRQFRLSTTNKRVA